MKKLFVAALCLTSLNLWAETIQTEILDIEKDEQGYVVYAADGQVYEVSSEEEAKKAITAAEMGVQVKLDLGNTYNTSEIIEARNQIVEISLTSEAVEGSSTQKDRRNRYYSRYNAEDLFSSYISDFDTESEVQTLFNTLRNDTHPKSQCYNRAHVWSWELHRNYNNGKRVQTGKIWLFFTKKYIKAYRYKWWFHIAPYLTVNSDVRVIDRSFSYSPDTERGWTNRFMQNSARCPEVRRYTDYSQNQWDAYCYVIKTSVYYWQPWQIESLEKGGQVRNQWNDWEVRKAYKNGIGRRARVPSL